MRFFLTLFLFLSFPVFAQTFLPGTEDIPLMNELQNVEETASFDDPLERMVLISAETKNSPKKVLQFYTETLKNLGWMMKKPGHFERGADTFSIEITPIQNGIQIQFRLSQRNS